MLQEKGKLEVNFQELDVNIIIKDTLRGLRPLINNKEIKSVESNLIKDNSEAIIQLLYLKEYLKIYDKNNTTSKKLVKKII